jgi:hypothetical protein
LKQISEYKRDNRLSETIELYAEISTLADQREPYTESVKIKENDYITKSSEYWKELE